ncbi:FecR family protein [Vreelandella arcis]|uniref:FecR protein n=1 Tax=Vreelandella arcis TaxID=416873 RepID=A0A1H0I3H6_9GAMM|nr:FecR domain-containing protein [Halomonas arcis]SDO25988.1 FecR protein [Halomonas arcis]
MAIFHKHSLARATSLSLSSLALLPFPTFADTPAGRVMFVHGDATIERDGKRFKAERGDDIFAGDTFHTAQASTLQLRYSDGGTKALRPESTYTIERYVLDEEVPDNSTQGGELLRGGLRAITGAIGKNAPENVEYSTPVATMGIRGTSFQMLHIPDGGSPSLPRLESGSYLYVESGLIAMSTDIGETFVRPGQVFFTPALSAAPQLLPDGLSIFEALDENSPQASPDDDSAEPSNAATQGDTSTTGSTSSSSTSLIRGSFVENAELTPNGNSRSLQDTLSERQATSRLPAGAPQVPTEAQQLGFANTNSMLNQGINGSDEEFLGESGQLLLTNGENGSQAVSSDATRWNEKLRSAALGDERLQTRANAEPENFQVISLGERDATSDSTTAIYWGRWASEDIAKLSADGKILLTPLGNLGDLHYVGSNNVINVNSDDADGIQQIIELGERLANIEIDGAEEQKRVDFSLVTPGELTSSEGTLEVRDDSRFSLAYQTVDGEEKLHAQARFYLVDEQGNVYLAQAYESLAALFSNDEKVASRLTFDTTDQLDHLLRQASEREGRVVLPVSGGHFTSRFTGQSSGDGEYASIDGVIGNLYVEIDDGKRSAYGSLGFGLDAPEARWTDIEPSPQSEVVYDLYKRNIAPSSLGDHAVDDGKIVWGYWEEGTEVHLLSGETYTLSAPLPFITASLEVAGSVRESLSGAARDALSAQLDDGGVTFNWVDGTGLVSDDNGDVIPILDTSSITLSNAQGVSIDIFLDDYGKLTATHTPDNFSLDDPLSLEGETVAGDAHSFASGGLVGRYVGEEANAIMSLIQAWDLNSNDDIINLHTGTGAFDRQSVPNSPPDVQ